MSTASSSSPVPSETSRVISIYDIIRLSSSFLLSQNHEKPPKVPANQRKPPTVSYMCPFEVDWHWFRVKFVQMDRFMILFVYLLVALFSLKTLRNQPKSSKIKEKLKLFLICVDFKLTCTGSISYVTDSIDFISSGPMWRPENRPIPAKTTIDDEKIWIDSDVHRLQSNQYRFQV